MLPELFKLLKDKACIPPETEFYDFNLCFTGVNSRYINNPIIWRQPLTLLLKILIFLYEKNFLSKLENKSIDLCFNNNSPNDKFGDRIRKDKNKLKSRVDRSLSEESTAIYNDIMPIFM
jgi:hypothetical protein